MNTLKQFAIQLIIAIGTLVTVGWLIRTGEEHQSKGLKEYWENSEFRVDSQVVNIDYSKIPIEEFINYVPPAILIEYVDSTKTYYNREIVYNDSLFQVIDSLENVIATISKDFLLNYPHAPKLIYALLSKDTVFMDLLNIKGNMVREIYPVNFNRFVYQFKDQELRAKELPIHKSTNNKFLSNTEWYVNAGYLWTSRTPIVGSNLYTNLNNWQFQVNTGITIESSPSLNFQTTVGYRVSPWVKE